MSSLDRILANKIKELLDDVNSNFHLLQLDYEIAQLDIQSLTKERDELKDLYKKSLAIIDNIKEQLNKG